MHNFQGSCNIIFTVSNNARKQIVTVRGSKNRVIIERHNNRFCKCVQKYGVVSIMHIEQFIDESP